MMTIIVNNEARFEQDGLLAGLHVKAPTFIEFMIALQRALDKNLESLYIYDDRGQFATMEQWALEGKIKELTGVAVKVNRVFS